MGKKSSDPGLGVNFQGGGKTVEAGAKKSTRNPSPPTGTKRLPPPGKSR